MRGPCPYSSRDSSFENCFHCFRVVRGDCRSNVATDINDQGEPLVRALGVEIPPMYEVARSPDSPTPHCVEACKWQLGDTLDGCIWNSLGAPEVVPADHKLLSVARDPTVVVERSIGAVHRSLLIDIDSDNATTNEPVRVLSNLRRSYILGVTIHQSASRLELEHRLTPTISCQKRYGSSL